MAKSLIEVLANVLTFVIHIETTKMVLAVFRRVIVNIFRVEQGKLHFIRHLAVKSFCLLKVG